MSVRLSRKKAFGCLIIGIPAYLLLKALHFQSCLSYLGLGLFVGVALGALAFHLLGGSASFSDFTNFLAPAEEAIILYAFISPPVWALTFWWFARPDQAQELSQ